MDSKQIQTVKRNHAVNLENREKGFITGVEKVVSSNDTQLSLETSAGGLTVVGSELKINKFDAESGALAFLGSVNALKYSGAKVSFLKRIFS